MGSTLLKWRLDSLLGIGGMAAVYAATHLKNRSRVALKVLHRELSANHEIRERFQREAYVANSVDHEGAVEVREDYLSEDDEPVLVMELLRGKSLEAVQAERGALSALEALTYADQVLDVLAAAHDKGIVHRDIKPQNLFVTQTGRVKVLDFGVARMLDGAASATLTGSLLGTPAFMPPEQASGRTSAICGRSDLWSVGATMFTLLTGRFVHEAENAQAHTIKAAVTRARSLASLLPSAPPLVVELVDRALAFEIADRWADARDMQSAVRRAIRALAPDGESVDEGAETSTFPQGVQALRAASPEAKPPRTAPLAADAKKDEPSDDGEDEETSIATRDGFRSLVGHAHAPPPKAAAAPDESDDGEDDETSVAKRDEIRAFLSARAGGPPQPRAAEPPTLSPRAQPMADAQRAAPRLATGLDDDSTTSVIVVPPPAFPARPSRPGAPPPPPPPEPSRSEAARLAGLAMTEVAPLEPARPTEQTLPLSALPGSERSSVLPTTPLVPFPQESARQAPARESFPVGTPLFAPPPSVAQTAPLFSAPPAPAPLPTLDLQAPSLMGGAPFPPAVPPPEATSVSAQSISQVTPPARRRSRLLSPEILAITGAILAVLIVSYFVITAILGGGSTAPAGTTTAEAPGLSATAQLNGPAPTPPLGSTSAQEQPPGAPTPATAEPTAQATSEPAPTAEPTATATPTHKTPVYKPRVVDPSTKRWPTKPKPFAPDDL